MSRRWERCEMHGEFEDKADLGWDNIKTDLSNGI
jgi:hypothetical protein